MDGLLAVGRDANGLTIGSTMDSNLKVNNNNTGLEGEKSGLKRERGEGTMTWTNILILPV